MPLSEMEFSVSIILVRNRSLSKKVERDMTSVSQFRMESKMVNDRIVIVAIVETFDCVRCTFVVCVD